MAFRKYKRNKSLFFINLIGLTLGLASTFMICLWINSELRIDTFHEKDGQLYQVLHNIPLSDGSILTDRSTPGLLADALANQMPEVEYAVAVADGNVGIISTDDQHIKARAKFGGKDYFNVFSFQLLQGDKNEALSDKYGVLLSEQLALKLFHTTENIVGNTLNWYREGFNEHLTIKGIFKSPPVYSTEQFDLLLSYELYFDKNESLANWGNSSPDTYITLIKGTDESQFNNKIRDFIKDRFTAQNGSEGLEGIGSLFIQRYSKRYLYDQFENGVQTGGRIIYIRLFSIIAIFILAIACINFMNLNTANTTKSAKEVGIKKVIGANRKTLIKQFLGESILITSLSLVCAILLVIFFLPAFARITGNTLIHGLDINFVLAILGIALLTGLISGSYPAFFLSGLKADNILKSRYRAFIGEARIRKGLVVFQFAVSTIFIVSVLVVYNQISYIQSKNLGYSKENVIQFSSEGKLSENLEPFISEVKNIPGVINASAYANNLVGNYSSTGALTWGDDEPRKGIIFGYFEVYYDLVEVLGMQIAKGQSFSRNFGTSDSQIVFNEAAIAAMNLEDPIGKTVKLWGRNMQIIGVIEDFNFESMYNSVKPCFLIYDDEEVKNILVKLNAGSERNAIEKIDKLYQQNNAGVRLNFEFLDEDYQRLYASEQRVAVLSEYATGIAIIISCLGLLGLTAFAMDRRRKEINVRKILGSNKRDIVFLLTMDFSKMILMALLIALPLSYLTSKTWLENFAYRISLEWWYFVMAGILMLFICWLTVGIHIIKASRLNIVDGLVRE